MYTPQAPRQWLVYERLCRLGGDTYALQSIWPNASLSIEPTPCLPGTYLNAKHVATGHAGLQ